jgi:hypothetical protein
MKDQAPTDLGEGFARETGQLVVRGWRIWLTLYLLLAATNTVIEWRGYHTRWYALLTVYAVQVVVVAGAWLAMRRSTVYPRVAWIALAGNLSICFAQALYNAHVAGDTLYEFITFLSFMLVSSLFIPWGARFQAAQNIGIIAAYWLAVPRGAPPVPAYDYLAIIGKAGFSGLGAFLVSGKCPCFARSDIGSLDCGMANLCSRSFAVTRSPLTGPSDRSAHARRVRQVGGENEQASI